MTDLPNASVLPLQPLLTPEQAAGCLRFARSAIMCALGYGTREPYRRLPALLVQKVNVTIYCDHVLRASMSGDGPQLANAIRGAAVRASKDTRFGMKLTRTELTTSRIELWIQRSSVVLGKASEIDLGLDGVELRVGSAYAYFKPSVPLTSRIVSPTRLLEKLSRKAGLESSAWATPEAVISRTRWDHYVEANIEPPQALFLQRMRPTGNVYVNPTTVALALASAQKRLASAQNVNGVFRPRFHPFQPAKGDRTVHLVRQAGCAYALARASEASTPHLLKTVLATSALRAIAFLLTFKEWSPEVRVFFREPSSSGSASRGKLGTMALILCTLQCEPFARDYESDRAELLSSILSMQRRDGSFCCWTDSRSPVDDGTKRDFFPGQALFGIGREMLLGGRVDLGIVERAFHFYTKYFRSNPTSAFVVWQVNSWKCLAEALANEPRQRAIMGEAAAFVFEMIDWLLGFQLVEATDAVAVGGFVTGTCGPNFSTAAYTEAVLEALKLAIRLNATERIQRYRRASLLGLSFVMRLQIPPVPGSLFNDPELMVGGLPHSFSNFEIRCDHDQHMISAMLAAMDTPGLFE